MDLLKAVRLYVDKMANDVAGPKVLLLDAETMKIVSLAYSQAAILQKDVFLFERLDSRGRERMAHLRALVLARPTDATLRALSDELESPAYGEYHCYFTNAISSTQLEALARADTHAAVRSVIELYADYYALASDTFHLGLPSLMLHSRAAAWTETDLRRTVDGLASVCCALKRRPQLRYAAGSELARDVAIDLGRRMNAEAALFDFRASSTLLLIVDRKDDPVTPLLSQWTYEAMVHELLGLDNHRVDMSATPNVRADLKQIVLAAHDDAFFGTNRDTNFGDLGERLRELVYDYQKKTNASSKLDSIADIKKFVEAFPEFRKLEGNVSKHVAVVGELSRLVEARKLYDVSELEQEIANKQDHTTAKANVLTFVRNDALRAEERQRLAMLYALRYEHASGSAVDTIIEELSARQVSPSGIADVLAYGGSGRRTGDLFSNKNLTALLKSAAKRGVKGAVNVYTEHRPMLSSTLEALLRNRLRDVDFPLAPGGGKGGTAVSSGSSVGGSSATVAPPQEVIIFVVGGATYEEAVALRAVAREHSKVSVLLGGSTFHNTASFMQQLRDVKR